MGYMPQFNAKKMFYYILTLRFCLLFYVCLPFFLLRLFVNFCCYECESLESSLAVLLLLLFFILLVLTLNTVLIFLQNNIIGSTQLFVYICHLYRMKKKIFRGFMLTHVVRDRLF